MTDSPPAEKAAASGSTLGRRLQEARERLGITQEEAAQRAGMQASAWSHFETGTRSPNVRNLRRLCRALMVSADWLLGLPVEKPDARNALFVLIHHIRRIAPELETLVELSRQDEPSAWNTEADL